MGIFGNILGLALVAVSWFDPFGFSLLVRIVLFILGFDMMGLVPKIGLFAIYFFYPVFGTALGYLSWTLLLLFLSEISLSILHLEEPFRFFVKPLAVFATAFVALGFQPALIAAGADLIFNLTHKIKL